MYIAMAYRYCPECDKWYRTAEYTVDEMGETVCDEVEEHGAVHGYIDGSMETVADYKQHTYRTDVEDEVEAAVNQGILRR